MADEIVSIPDSEKDHQKTPEPMGHKSFAKPHLNQLPLPAQPLPFIRPRELANIHTASGANHLRYQLRELYEMLQKNIDKNNTMVYDRCCLNFTTRTQMKVNNHPSDCQIKVRKLFKDQKIKDINSFNRFIFNELGYFPLEYQLVPGLNEKHDPELRRSSDIYVQLD